MPESEETDMKQMVILISMIMLGIIIGTIVLSFGEQADTMGQQVNDRIESVMSDFNSAAGG